MNETAPPKTISLEVNTVAVRALYARMDDYFGAWAILPRRMQAAAAHLQRIDLVAHVKQTLAEKAAAGSGGGAQRGDYDVADGVAIVEVVGSLMKSPSSLDDSASSIEIRRVLRTAANDPDVHGILVRGDSPGGTVAGTSDLAEDIAAIGQSKPVWWYCEDLTASAAYWLASQCAKVFCNATALVGSIGTYIRIADCFDAASKEGVTIHVIRTGPYKGAGVPGTKITEEQLAAWQTEVDDLNDQFVAAVARGRGLSEKAVREVADGQVYIGQKAKELGLVDGIQSFDETLSQLQQLGSFSMSTTNGGQAATQQAAPVAATIQQLKAACPGADSDFLMQQLEAGASEGTAMRAWMQLQQQRLDQERTAREEAERKADWPPPPAGAGAGPGVDRPLGGGKAAGKGKGKGKGKPCDDEMSDDEDDDVDADETELPEQKFPRLVREEMKFNGGDYRKAIRTVATRDPQLHEDWVVATAADPEEARMMLNRRERTKREAAQKGRRHGPQAARSQ